MKRTPQEVMAGGYVNHEDFGMFLKAFQSLHNTTTFLLLENQPRARVHPDQRHNLLLFSELTSELTTTVNIAEYTSGRIFNVYSELRWEKQMAHIQVVYTGDRAYTPTLKLSEEQMLDAYRPITRRYFLFGKQLEPKQLQHIGPPAQPGDFVEVRIPRLLRYPALESLKGTQYIKLTICEYIDPTNGATITYRFKKLVPCKQSPKEVKV